MKEVAAEVAVAEKRSCPQMSDRHFLPAWSHIRYDIDQKDNCHKRYTCQGRIHFHSQ